ncbi:hypothetical protein V3851_09035 [Paenibacillus sp. M1]|uniref:Uncharacterized protein n=1 Tax=Paenibacillus haidiansis TaxID=1574488 RepID=A0ABU7VRQ3_9BACL
MMSNYEELYRRELELQAFHDPKKQSRFMQHECRTRKMTYRCKRGKKTWFSRVISTLFL